ncbi:hypothetical protein [Niabella hirudinis]|uniref:hypothetical protein n=1 Tax=Niabella hirudinis TaxID=1285929 RepID=UPI003EBCDAF8
MGTKISYKSVGHNPHGDNRINLRGIAPIDPEPSFEEAFDDPTFQFMYVTDNEVFGVNKLKYNKKKFILLEPNPVSCYFSIAYDLVKQIDTARNQLNEVLQKKRTNNDYDLAVPFSYVFKVASIGVVFSCLALEAFMNQMLPDYKKIAFKGKQMSKQDVERWVSFEDKFSKIIPQIDGRNFCELHSSRAMTIRKLKKLRDSFVHLKQKRADGFTSYDEIYQEALQINYDTVS